MNESTNVVTPAAVTTPCACTAAPQPTVPAVAAAPAAPAPAKPAAAPQAQPFAAKSSKRNKKR